MESGLGGLLLSSRTNEDQSEDLKDHMNKKIPADLPPQQTRLQPGSDVFVPSLTGFSDPHDLGSSF